MLTGYDVVQYQAIFKNHFHYPDGLWLDCYFADIIEITPEGDSNVRYQHVHQLKPLFGSASEALC